MRVLCLDGGSSTLKYAAYDIGAANERRLHEGSVETKGGPGASAPLEALDEALRDLDGAGTQRFDAVGHRIVFGGPDHREPVLAEAATLEGLRRFESIDPLHLPAQLELVRKAKERLGGLPQILCFDTAFHQRMPDIAKRYPLPASLGRFIRRYGFHGLSYEYVTAMLGARCGAAIIAHLGSGASLAAVRDGVPVDTTMGFSPLGGLMMGTRPGDLDPGLLLYLLHDGWSPSDLDSLLTQRAGLLAVSERSSAMVELLAHSDDAKAHAAVELFAYQARKHIGAMVAALDGLDVLVFTGGIGEGAASVRAAICANLARFGVALDPAANAAHADVISDAASAVSVRVIKTNENLMIARHCAALLAHTMS